MIAEGEEARRIFTAGYRKVPPLKAIYLEQNRSFIQISLSSRKEKPAASEAFAVVETIRKNSSLKRRELQQLVHIPWANFQELCPRI